MQQPFMFGKETILNDESGRLLLIPEALDSSSEQFYFDRLLREIRWRQDRLFIAGKYVAIPRLQAWYGDENACYNYSGLSLTPEPWIQTLLDLKSVTEGLCGGVFNSVLLNLYRDGRDSMGWHSDDELELGVEPLIASLSLGAERYFSLRRKKKHGDKIKIKLPPGSLLIMSGNLQSNWQHQVPKTSLSVGQRINLTFRSISAP